MTADAAPNVPEGESGSSLLPLLLAMAMFVLVVDTSLMNVSISAVVHDLHTTASGVQSAIALEALVSAAFILISSKVGDFIGRKRAYVLGLLAYAIGAFAMTVAQSLTAIIIFWAIIGGLGASLLLPAMQSLIHGNFEGAARTKAYALVGAAAAIAAAIGPLLGGFVTTYLSWRVGFALEVVIIGVVLSGIRLVRDVKYTGPRQIDAVGSALSVIGMGGVVLGILVWQEGGDFVVLIMALGASALALLAWWLVKRKREGHATLLDPGLFRFPHFRIGISQTMMQQITLGGAMIALPLFLQMTLEYNAMEAGLSLAPLSLSMFGVALLAGKRAGRRRPADIVLTGFALTTIGIGSIIPVMPRAESGWALLVPLLIAGSGLGLLVSQLNNYTLSPIEEAARQRSRGRELRLRIVRAVVRARDGGWPHARRPLLELHAHGRQQRGDPTRPAATDRDDTRGQRRGDEQHPARGAPHEGAAGGEGGDPAHQHRRAESLASSRTPRARAREPARPHQWLPHAATPGDRAGRERRRPRPRLTEHPSGRRAAPECDTMCAFARAARTRSGIRRVVSEPGARAKGGRRREW